MAALHSDHYRQVLLYMILLDQGRLAAVDRRLPYTVTTIDKFYGTCTSLHAAIQPVNPPKVYERSHPAFDVGGVLDNELKLWDEVSQKWSLNEQHAQREYSAGLEERK